MSERRLDYSHAIETVYRSFLFRSRAEAKIAVFFDLCGWAWSYEPKDFNGWIPDFAIGETATLVEVKPFFHEIEWSEAIQKIADSGCHEDVILLGADLVWSANNLSSNDDEAPVVGFLREHDGSVWPLNFGITEGNGKLGLCSLDGPWWNPIWKPPPNISHPNKWSRVHLTQEQSEAFLVRNWARACNASRWMKYES